MALAEINRLSPQNEGCRNKIGADRPAIGWKGRRLLDQLTDFRCVAKAKQEEWQGVAAQLLPKLNILGCLDRPCGCQSRRRALVFTFFIRTRDHGPCL
jgi:hypothetical protein